MTKAVTLASSAPLTGLGELVDRANAYARDARASSTRRAYAGAFALFESWCAQKGLASLPTTPATVAVYVAELADRGRAVATLERTLAAIAHAHRTRGLAWPRAHETIGAVMAGIRRRHGVAATARKAPLEADALARVVDAIGTDVRDVRDRALLLLGWGGAFRRSELIALDVGDVREQHEGLVVRLRRSKRDQEGRGFEKGIPRANDPTLCAVRALRAWLGAASLHEGPLFRAIDARGRIAPRRLCDKSVLLIVQKRAERAGLNPALFGGHSLRAGFCTTAARKGRSLEAIMRHTGHKDARVARRYIRMASVFNDNALEGLL